AFQKASATQSYLHMAFHAPGVLHPDGPAIEFLSFLLSAGRSARLHRYLVEEKRSASTVSCSYQAYEDIGVIVVSAITEAPSIRNASSDIRSVLRDLLQHRIPEAELEKIKSKLKLQQLMQAEEALNV